MKHRIVGVSAEDFQQLLKRFSAVSRQRLADAFLVTRVTLYGWEKHGIPTHNAYACLLYRRIQDTLANQPGSTPLDKLLNIHSLLKITVTDIPPPSCIVSVGGIKCNKGIVKPTMLCPQHLHMLFNGEELVDFNGDPITVTFMKEYGDWETQRCIAYTTTSKNRCKRYAINGRKFCPIHNDIIKKGDRVYADIEGTPQYVDYHHECYKVKTGVA